MPAPQFPELDEEIERLAWESLPEFDPAAPALDQAAWVSGFEAGYKARRAEIEWLKQQLAAAPDRDMYEALKECLLEHGGYTIKGECERRARAAIAKAEAWAESRQQGG